MLLTPKDGEEFITLAGYKLESVFRTRRNEPGRICSVHQFRAADRRL